MLYEFVLAVLFNVDDSYILLNIVFCLQKDIKYYVAASFPCLEIKQEKSSAKKSLTMQFNVPWWETVRLNQEMMQLNMKHCVKYSPKQSVDHFNTREPHNSPIVNTLLYRNLQK